MASVLDGWWNTSLGVVIEIEGNSGVAKTSASEHHGVGDAILKINEVDGHRFLGEHLFPVDGKWYSFVGSYDADGYMNGPLLKLKWSTGFESHMTPHE